MTLLSLLFTLFNMSIVQVTDFKVNPLVYADVLNMPCLIFCLLRREVHIRAVVSTLWNSFMSLFVICLD